MPTDIDAAVGARIRARRNELRLSIAGLAERSGGRFKPSILGGYERGQRALSVAGLIDLADVLDVSPAHLLPIEHGGRPLRITIEGDRIDDLADLLEVARTPDTDPVPYVPTTEVA